MEAKVKKEVKKVRLFYMYFYREGKLERSPEYRSFEEFYQACGAWCNAHPLDWKLNFRDTVEVAE